jgi:hypothetical protein
MLLAYGLILASFSGCSVFHFCIKENNNDIHIPHQESSNSDTNSNTGNANNNANDSMESDPLSQTLALIESLIESEASKTTKVKFVVEYEELYHELKKASTDGEPVDRFLSAVLIWL